jgi:hypothetical protein
MRFYDWLALLTLLTGPRLLHAETAHSPGTSQYASWEPFGYGVDGIPGVTFDRLQANIDVTYDQGYNLLRRYRTSRFSRNYGDCTRANWDGFPRAIGIAQVCTHGSSGLLVAISVRSKAMGDAWRNAGADNSHIRVGVDDETGEARIRVKAPWFKRNWETFFNVTESIVYIVGCRSAGGQYSIIKSLGGRLVLGYSTTTDAGNAAQDIDLLFLRMNGVEPEGTKRLASLAIGAGGFTSGFTNVLRGETTLCPAVSKATLDNIHPHGPGTARSGDGRIVFDTKLNTATQSAAEALTFKVMTGSVDITNVRWSGDHEITFHWEAAPSYTSGGYGAAFKVKAAAHADKVVAFGAGAQQLDGGDLSENESSPDGVASNGDDFIWVFSGQ